MSNIDKYLGSFTSRYFGAGHKETSYFFKNKVKNKNEYVFRLQQNGLWSEKNGIEQIAHLSTIDGIVLANMAAEIFFCNNLNLDNNKIYLAKFDIKAGSTPIENLNEVSAICIKSEIGEKMIELHYRINGMRIILGYKSIDKSGFSRLSDTMQSYTFMDQKDYISNHLKFLKHDITNIDNIGQKGIVCDVIRNSSLPNGMKGVNSKIQEIPSLVEWLVVFSQMAQVVAYKFDCVDRNQSSTLWMKHVKAEIKELSFDSGSQTMTWGEINEAKLLQMKGRSWRTFTMFGEVPEYNVNFIGKIAHQLPLIKSISEVQRDGR